MKYIWLLGWIVGMFYWNDLPIWDDHFFVEYLQQRSMGDLWTEPVQGSVGGQYYRPMVMSVLALCSSISVVHWLVSLVHASSSVLFAKILQQQQIETYWLWAGTFAIYPLHTETLAWASCLPDILAVHCGLWSVWSWYHSTQSNDRRWLCYSMVCIGLLCKETACIPLLCVLLHERKATNVVSALLPLAFVISMVLGIRYLVGVVSPDFSHNVDLVPSIVLHNLGGLVYPFPHYPIRDLHSLPQYNWWLGGCVLLGLIVQGIRKNTLAWVAMILLPILFALPPVLTGYLVAERYLYMSVVGWMLFLAWNSKEIVYHRRYNGLVAMVIIGAMCVHWQRKDMWRSDLTLFQSSAQVLPNSGYTWHFLGMVQLYSEDYAACAKSMQHAIQQQHYHYEDHLWGLYCLVQDGQWVEATRWVDTGPRDGLAREYIELWLEVARHNDDKTRIQELENLLR